VRTQELSHACRLLGITSVQLVDDPSLPDGMDALWSPTAVMGHVAAAVAAHKPSSVRSSLAGRHLTPQI
jgi:LmbE family N-acetylglucosaminyl deacetylase